jgi:hypothetical protein
MFANEKILYSIENMIINQRLQEYIIRMIIKMINVHREHIARLMMNNNCQTINNLIMKNN